MIGIMLSDEKRKAAPWHLGTGLLLSARSWYSLVEHKFNLTEHQYQARSLCDPDEIRQTGKTSS